ncbi:MAG: hypothetical protein U5K37_09800 [Natrialbaceae archaeon]|nr:hypothetical protein [Natrialbaceae archaeon]
MIFTTSLVPVTVTWGVRMLERADELVYLDGHPSGQSGPSRPYTFVGLVTPT